MHRQHLRVALDAVEYLKELMPAVVTRELKALDLCVALLYLAVNVGHLFVKQEPARRSFALIRNKRDAVLVAVCYLLCVEYCRAAYEHASRRNYGARLVHHLL